MSNVELSLARTSLLSWRTSKPKPGTKQRRPVSRRDLVRTYSFDDAWPTSRSVPHDPGETIAAPAVRVSAYYLPQFHPIPENDAWWGPGFTEWTNVAKARPLYPGHRQPKLPGALGFYDLRTPETRLAQAELARDAGVSAFAYWHYWFAGRQILERPLQDVLHSGEPSLPFYFAWANESWTGHWHGLSKSMLLEQTYPGEDDDRRHFEYIEPFLHDPRYFRLDGRPVFSIYKPGRHPSMPAMIERWHDWAQASGLPGIYWIGQVDAVDDLAAIARTVDRVHFNPQQYWAPLLGVPGRVLHWTRLPRLIDARRTAERLAASLRESPVLAPCVVPDWDNTPRSQRRGLVMVRNSKEAFAAQLKVAFDHERARTASTGRDGIVLVKSWNEWAEGNCLEPGGTWGTRYLDALREAQPTLRSAAATQPSDA